MMLVRIMMPLAAVLLIFSGRAQTNGPRPEGPSPEQRDTAVESKEQMRSHCIEGRRSICGRIIRMMPDGVLVEAGYTNLLREPLTKSWLVPASVTASLAPNPVESKEPGAICLGTVFLTDLPRGKPHVYDYVILAGYPTGETTYTAVGIKKTVRRFSANLDKAVQFNLAITNARASAGPAK